MARINFKKRGPFVDVADPSNPPSVAKDLPAEWFNNIETAIKGLDDFTDDAATTVKATDTQGITETTNKGKKIFLQVLLDKIVNMVNTLNRKTLSGNVRGNENNGTVKIDGVAWYYKDIKFSERFEGWPIISVGYVSNVDAQHGKERCFVTNVSATGFRMIFENASGNAYYNWIASKQFN